MINSKFQYNYTKKRIIILQDIKLRYEKFKQLNFYNQFIASLDIKIKKLLNEIKNYEISMQSSIHW